MAGDVEIVFDPVLGARAVKKFENDTEKLGKKSGKKASTGFSSELKKGFKRLSIVDIGVGAAFGQLAANAIIGFGRAITGTFSEAIQAAGRQEDAINKVNASLRQTGEFTREASKDIQDFASSIQQVTRFGDEAILEQVAFAKSLGLTVDQAKQVVAAGTDLSAALGITLESAVRNLAKTFSGLKGELGEQVASIRTLTAEQLRNGEAVNIIAKQFAGFAQSEANTFQGRLQQLTNASGDFFENLGFIITRSKLASGAIELLTKAVTSLNSQFSDATAESQDLEKELLKLQKRQAELAKSRGVRFEFNAAEARNVNQRIQDILTELDRREEEATQQSRVNADQRVADKKKEVEEKLTAEKNFQQQLGTIGLTQNQILEEQLVQRAEILATAREMEIISEEEFVMRRDQLLADFEAKQAQSLENQVIQFDSFFNQVGAGFASFGKQVFVTGKSIANTLSRGIGNAAASGFATFGRALVEGENALEAFGKAFLGVIGQTAIQLGTSFILQGIAWSLNPLTPGAGGPLIAAGAALATFGGVLSAISGGGGGGGAGGAAGGGGEFGGFSQPDQSFAAVDPEDREAQQSVQLVVQGDILDSEDTGRRLVSLLNENFEREGTVITGASFA